MSEGMTPEQCRAAQLACSKNIFDAISELRRETKADIGAIRDVAQNIDRAVARISGYLGLNGGTPAAYVHHRDSDEAATVVAEAARAAAAKVNEAADLALAKVAAAVVAANVKAHDPEAMPALPWKAWIALAALFMMVVGLALVAGKEGLTIWPKTYTPNTLATK